MLRVYLCNIAMHFVPWMKCEHYLELRADYRVILCSWCLVLVCWNGDSLQHRCECVVKPCVYVCDWVIWVCMGDCALHPVPILSTWLERRAWVKPIFTIHFVSNIKIHGVTKILMLSIKINYFLNCLDIVSQKQNISSIYPYFYIT